MAVKFSEQKEQMRTFMQAQTAEMRDEVVEKKRNCGRNGIQK